MVQGITAGTLAFVLVGALVALLGLGLSIGKRSNKTKKEKPESTLI